MLIIEYPNVTVKCRAAIEEIFLDFNLCLSVVIVLHVHLHLSFFTNHYVEMYISD